MMLARQTFYMDLNRMNVQVASIFMGKQKMDQYSTCKTIVSCYVDGMTPPIEVLSCCVARLQSTGADLIKLVINATNITEITKIFHLLSHCQV